MQYKIGDRVSWKAANRDYSGTVTGFFRTFAVAQIDGSGKCVLLDNKEPKPKTNKL